MNRADCGGWGIRGTVKNHNKSEAGDLVPVRKGRVEEADSKMETEVGVKMAKPVRAKKRRQTNKRMKESEVRQKITEDGRGFVREGEPTGQVRGAAHLQDRAVRKSERDDG